MKRAIIAAAASAIGPGRPVGLMFPAPEGSPPDTASDTPPVSLSVSRALLRSRVRLRDSIQTPLQRQHVPHGNDVTTCQHTPRRRVARPLTDGYWHRGPSRTTFINSIVGQGGFLRRTPPSP